MGAGTNRAEAFWVVGRELGEIRSEALCAPGPNEVLVRTLYSGVSRGTELTVFRGQVPPSEYARMRAPHQAGDFPWPVKFGYASVGRVVEGARDLVHREVLCLYPHQTAYVVPEDALVPLPPGIPAARAVLAANLETALNAMWDAPIQAGDRVAVVGAGVVGSLVAYLAARHPGTDVELVDIDERKRKIAGALDVGFALPGGARAGADVVVHASGAPEGLRTAIDLAGDDATVVELSWFGNRPVELPLGERFHAGRIRIQSSQVGQLPPARRARWTRRRRLEVALSLLSDPRLDALVTGESPFHELPDVMRRLSSAEGPALCERILYDSSPSR